MVKAGDFPGVIRIGNGRLIRIPWSEVEKFVGVIHPRVDGDATVAQVAFALSVHPETVRELARANRFPGAYKTGSGKINSPIRIPWSDVQAFREKQPRVHG